MQCKSASGAGANVIQEEIRRAAEMYALGDFNGYSLIMMRYFPSQEAERLFVAGAYKEAARIYRALHRASEQKGDKRTLAPSGD